MTSRLPRPFPELFAHLLRRVWTISLQRVGLATAAIAGARLAHLTLVTVAACIVVGIMFVLPLAIDLFALWPMNRRWMAALARDPSRLAWAHVEADRPLIELRDRDNDPLYVLVPRARHAALVAELRAFAPELKLTTTSDERAAHVSIAEYLAKLGMVERGFADPAVSPRVRELGAPYARWLEAWTAGDHDAVARGEAVIALDQILHYQSCARDAFARDRGWFVDETAAAISKLPRPDAAPSPFRQ